MKAFAFAVLASLAVVSTEAGLSILSPTCTIKGKSDKSYSKNDCITHKSSFQMMYKGKMQFMMGKILNLGACDADGNPYGKCYRVNDALFGVNPYGEKINGQLFYEFLKDSTGCTRVEPSFGFHDDGSNPTKKVLLLDRGSCSFVTKVRMAQVSSFLMKISRNSLRVLCILSNCRMLELLPPLSWTTITNTQRECSWLMMALPLTSQFRP